MQLQLREFNDSPKVLWLVKAQKAGPGVSAEEGSFLEAAGTHCVSPGLGPVRSGSGAPSGSCRRRSRERLVQALGGATLGALVLPCLGAGQKNCSVRRRSRGVLWPRCALSSLLRAWTGAFFPGLGFPGVLWLPEVSALPSWYLGLVLP